jgi:RNA polymerase sigma-70 factor (ECF subfamily)
MLRAAHGDPGATSQAAQEQLVHRYGGAIYRYLSRAVSDSAAAEDLTQEFVLKLIRGDFRHADPEHGRFRNYVKTALFHLVSSFRRAHRRPQTALERVAEPEAPDTEKDASEFNEDWRNELLSRAWDALAEDQPRSYAGLRLRAENPTMASPELACELSRQLGEQISADATRQLLHRARTRFAELLIDEVAHSLDAATPDTIAEELSELQLLDYCRTALARFQVKQFTSAPPDGPIG